MKKAIRTRFLTLVALLFALTCSVSLTSCEDDDYYWSVPSNGYIDSGLIGTWQLVQINGRFVNQFEANYFSFNSNGYGRYYYYVNGRPYAEGINYWCEYDYRGGNNWLMIDYPDQSTEQQYWFSDGGNSLWMQFVDGRGQVITYRYQWIDYAPW